MKGTDKLITAEVAQPVTSGTLKTLGLNLMMMNCFVVWLTDERRLALFPAGTIVRDPHHLESPTHREQDLNPADYLFPN